MSANTIVHKTTSTPAIVGPTGNLSTLSERRKLNVSFKNEKIEHD